MSKQLGKMMFARRWGRVDYGSSLFMATLPAIVGALWLNDNGCVGEFLGSPLGTPLCTMGMCGQTLLLIATMTIWYVPRIGAAAEILGAILNVPLLLETIAPVVYVIMMPGFEEKELGVFTNFRADSYDIAGLVLIAISLVSVCCILLFWKPIDNIEDHALIIGMLIGERHFDGAAPLNRNGSRLTRSQPEPPPKRRPASGDDLGR